MAILGRAALGSPLPVGSLFVGASGGSATSLTPGTTGQVLTVTSSGLIAWQNSSGGSTSLSFSNEGIGVVGGPFSNINFIGTAVQATNAGAGILDVTLTSSSGSNLGNSDLTLTSARIVNLAGFDLAFFGSKTSKVTNLGEFEGQGFKFYNGASTAAVTLKSSFTLGAAYSLELPSADGTAGQALVTNGAGVLSFSSSLSKFTKSFIVSDWVNVGSTSSFTVPASIHGKGLNLLSVQVFEDNSVSYQSMAIAVTINKTSGDVVLTVPTGLPGPFNGYVVII